MNIIQKIQRILYDHYGPLQWWPGDTPFEIAVGAILTQNTNWNNVVKAIENLKSDNLLNEQSIAGLPSEKLRALIRPAGYYNQKTRKLKIFTEFVMKHHNSSTEQFLQSDSLIELRKHLLSLWGIGPETADSILLYAGNFPVCVVDAYTKRIFSRHGLSQPSVDYETLRELIEKNLNASSETYNEFHAGLVHIAKDFCRKNNPECRACPLKVLFK